MMNRSHQKSVDETAYLFTALAGIPAYANQAERLGPCHSPFPGVSITRVPSFRSSEW